MDYYHSPCQSSPAEAAAPAAPSRRRGRAALWIFASLIALLTAGLVLLHIFAPGTGWSLTLDEIVDQFYDSDFFFDFPEDDFFFDGDLFGGEETKTSIPRAELDPDVKLLLADTPEQPLSYQEIYQKVLPSIVSIQAYTSLSGSLGTGIIMTADGYIITNHHVITGCSSASVVLHDGAEYEATLVGSDVESDLAVLKIQAEGLTSAEFGDSDLLQVGDTALAIGNPLGSELFGTMTEGIISAINRSVNVDGYDMSLIQTTAALNSGNSGGALVNSAGQVIGVTNMKMMSDYQTIEGLGFAIPTVWAKEVVDTLMADGAMTGRPTMGITCYALPSEEAALYGCSHGIYVDTVISHGPADKAGLLPSDIIITCNGRDVATLEDLTIVRDEAGVGGDMALTVLRGDETLELTLTLVEQYELN